MKTYQYLDKVNTPSDIKKINQSDLGKLAEELRNELIDVVSET